MQGESDHHQHYIRGCKSITKRPEAWIEVSMPSGNKSCIVRCNICNFRLLPDRLTESEQQNGLALAGCQGRLIYRDTGEVSGTVMLPS